MHGCKNSILRFEFCCFWFKFLNAQELPSRSPTTKVDWVEALFRAAEDLSIGRAMADSRHWQRAPPCGWTSRLRGVLLYEGTARPPIHIGDGRRRIGISPHVGVGEGGGGGEVAMVREEGDVAIACIGQRARFHSRSTTATTG